MGYGRSGQTRGDAIRLPHRRVVATASDATVRLTLSGRDLYGADLVATLSLFTSTGLRAEATIHFDALQDVLQGCGSHGFVKRERDMLTIDDGRGIVSLLLVRTLADAAFAAWDEVVVSRTFGRKSAA